MKKYSIVGLSLLAVSAVTAAFAPSAKESNSKLAINGHHTLSTGQPLQSPDVTCRALTPQEIEDEVVPNCSYTVTGNNNVNAGFSSTSGAGSLTDSATETQGRETGSVTSLIGQD